MGLKSTILTILTYRDEAIRRYYEIARKHNLFISGGTEFHSDGRTGMSDVKLDVNEAKNPKFRH